MPYATRFIVVLFAVCLLTASAGAASVSGVIRERGNQQAVAGATVRFGTAGTDTTDAAGAYQIPNISAGTYNTRISASGFLNHRRNVTLVNGANIYNDSLTLSSFPSEMKGNYLFDDAEDLTFATVGSDLQLVGSHTMIADSFGGHGVNIGVGSYYRCYHNIPANGGGSKVNQFTIVMDVRISQLGRWYTLYQTNASNANDGDWFINPTGNVGVGVTGYSSYALSPGEWYRLAISVSLEHHYTYYLDGQLLLNGLTQAIDDRFALEPASGLNQVLFFADENGEDNPIDVGQVSIYSRDLSASEISALGGFGHQPGPLDFNMLPYLQSPTDSSMWVCWHCAASTASTVQYGLTESLGQQATGTVQEFSTNIKWHTVQLTGLQPNTQYYYRCVSGTNQSEICRFRTPPQFAHRTGHFRFLILGDTRTTPSVVGRVARAARDKVIELYGPDWQNELNLVVHVGDIVTSGAILSQYPNEYFLPYSVLSSAVPFMVSIGNHEGESPYYYNYMKYESFAGPQGEPYYKYDLGPTRFIALNSNTMGTQQATWLSNVLQRSDTASALDWVFTYVHAPGHSELWPDGNNSWVQNSVLPLLANTAKSALLSYGHSHCYERGALRESNTRLLLSGGGGSPLDRWGMYSNQVDYPEITRALDQYSYVIVDMDLSDRSYVARMYSLGNDDRPRNNELLDMWHRRLQQAAPATPRALSATSFDNAPVKLTASPFTSPDSIMSSQFQITATPGNFSAPLIDTVRDWENIYRDSGSPNWDPIDRNAGIDLTRLRIPDSLFVDQHQYGWRVRYRDQNLQWSAWSAQGVFTYAPLAICADFVADSTSGYAPFTVRFTDLSVGDPDSWAWDFDNDGAVESTLRDPTFTFTSPGTYTVTLSVQYGSSWYTLTRENYITVNASAVAERGKLPATFELDQNYPNPFNPVTAIRFSLPDVSVVHLAVFNALGQQVAELASGERLPPGTYTRFLDASQLSSGIYFYRLQAGAYVASRKMVLLK